MRLLNTRTLEFEEFFESNVPKYLILSHRWEGKETTFQAFSTGRHLPPDEASAGIKKIRDFCGIALKAKYDWCWVDTCCIDKMSSAELTEAINSMWSWYARADSCFVYFSDVFAADARSLRDLLQGSMWFTRGWTLQELLAPRKQRFFDANWTFLGHRNEYKIREALSTITRIPSNYFGKIEAIRSATIAERMRWVSMRNTSRSEDLAYCMLGIFGIKMPLIYGEGFEAFLRLQTEIIKINDDESIFGWTNSKCSQSGLLASHPRCFADSRCSDFQLKTWINRPPFGMTNKGIELEIWASKSDREQSEMLLPINCAVENQGWIVIKLKKINDMSWHRISCDVLEFSTDLENPNEEASPDFIALNRSAGMPSSSAMEMHGRKFGSQDEYTIRNNIEFHLEYDRRRCKIYVRQDLQLGVSEMTSPTASKTPRRHEIRKSKVATTMPHRQNRLSSASTLDRYTSRTQESLSSNSISENDNPGNGSTVA